MLCSVSSRPATLSISVVFASINYTWHYVTLRNNYECEDAVLCSIFYQEYCPMWLISIYLLSLSRVMLNLKKLSSSLIVHFPGFYQCLHWHLFNIIYICRNMTGEGEADSIRRTQKKYYWRFVWKDTIIIIYRFVWYKSICKFFNAKQIHCPPVTTANRLRASTITIVTFPSIITGSSESVPWIRQPLDR